MGTTLFTASPRSALAAGALAVALTLGADAGAATPGMLPGADARDAALYALGLIGIGYRDGGDSPEGGFDCSGLTRHVLARTGVATLPRTAREQGETGAPVAAGALRSGDLVFFATQGSANSHVGIYVGEGRFVHAPGRGKGVTLADLGSPYWQRHYSGARRHAGGASGGGVPLAVSTPASRAWWTGGGTRSGSGLGNLPIAPEDVR